MHVRFDPQFKQFSEHPTHLPAISCSFSLHVRQPLSDPLAHVRQVEKQAEHLLLAPKKPSGHLERQLLLKRNKPALH
jgi:hypothetical protein